MESSCFTELMHENEIFGRLHHCTLSLSRFLIWNLKVHRSPEPDEMQSTSSNSVSLMVHFNIILASTAKSSKWCLPFELYNENVVCVT
jgi:hypothetical protein